MAHTYLKTASSRKVTPQSQPIPGKNQVENNAGGFAFQVEDWKRMERFLILGSEGNTYYCSEHKMTIDNVTCLGRCLKADGPRYVKMVEEISVSGRAPKNDPALLALALAFAQGDLETRQLAAAALPRVARIGTHLFHFADFVDGMRGWGPVLRNAVAEWYLEKDDLDLAYQLIKYQSRDGWSHRDLLRLAHPKAGESLRSTLFRYAVKGELSADHGTANPAMTILAAVEELKKLPVPPAASRSDEKRAIELITQHRLPRECVPTEWLNSVNVWAVMLPGMPMTAMIRNLGKMSAVGLLTPLSAAASVVVGKLSNEADLRKARVHPIQVLMALSTYKQGHGMRGKLEWKPVQRVVKALDDAFYKAFASVEPTGKRYYIALDISGSMGSGHVAGTPLTPREAAAAMAMVTMRTELQWHIAGFTAGNQPSRWSGMQNFSNIGCGISDLEMNPLMSLTDAVRYTGGLPMGGTDCALPMIDAAARKIEADVFYIITDNETWAGAIHPSQALNDYRQKMGIPAKMIVCGMTATEFSIADPSDPGSLDVVGFDANVPALIADFVTDGKVKTAETAEVE